MVEGSALGEIIELEGSVALEYYASLIVSELSELRPDDEPFVVVQRKPEVQPWGSHGCGSTQGSRATTR